MAGLILVAGAFACSRPDDGARAPSDPRLQKLFVQGSSYGHKIEIYADDHRIWSDEFTDRSAPAFEGEVHALPLPPELPARVSILGGPYKKDFTVDWTKGQQITIRFAKDGKILVTQLKGTKTTNL
ncbi:MAG: hypothetical protein HYV14_12425 [Elusimicrobia bacterium]|nr:hypothetical protein [Elusimicrobiota bacterium]